MMQESSHIHQQKNGTAPIQVATSLAPANNYRQDVHLNKHQRIRRTCTHNFSLVLSFVTCGAAVNLALAQMLGMAIESSIGWVEWIVRIYEMFFSTVIVFNELQWFDVIQASPILSLYTYRGILYIFVGILGVMMNDVGMDSSSQWNPYSNYGSSNITISIPTLEQALELYIQIVSWSMVAFGIMYMLMGVLRMQEKVERHKEEYKLRLAHARQEDSSKHVPLCGVMT